MSEIDRLGVERVLREALAFLARRAVPARQPRPRRGRPDVRAGRRHAGARRALLPRGAPRARARRRVGLLDSLELVEVNPILDRENETGKLAVELVASALGARIL